MIEACDCSKPKIEDSKSNFPEISDLEKKVRLYIITATYPRLEQLAELTRLGQTLKVCLSVHLSVFIVCLSSYGLSICPSASVHLVSQSIA